MATFTHISANDGLSILVVFKRSTEAKTSHHVVGFFGAKRTSNFCPLGPQIFQVPKDMRVLKVLKNASEKLVHAPLTLVHTTRPVTNEQAVRPESESNTPFGLLQDTKPL